MYLDFLNFTKITEKPQNTLEHNPQIKHSMDALTEILLSADCLICTNFDRNHFAGSRNVQVECLSSAPDGPPV